MEEYREKWRECAHVWGQGCDGVLGWVYEWRVCKWCVCVRMVCVYVKVKEAEEVR